ncbi:MAG: aldolase catalytic domain-containing protein [Muribaculaceae bacterium]|nr:aldolase catalytic domain-containing protein [Muribaculaceae bacterium]
MEHQFNILDCTLRDGGYYTDWDFAPNVVNTYLDAVNRLPIDYIEVGYRNNPDKTYMGEYGYCPVSSLKRIRERCNKKIAVMINEKSSRVEDLPYLVLPIEGVVDMVRIAVDPKNMDRAINLAKHIRDAGFEVGFNLMYMSKWGEYEGLFPKLAELEGVVTLLNMVDSFGSMMPDDVANTISKIREYTSCPLGFHGHNNLQLALINTLTAIKCGVISVDGTILGMGRGAGNLNTELLLTTLNRQGLDVDFNVLGDVITAYMPLLNQYGWGTTLPYMISGANSIPQKEVMAWCMNRAYSFNSIVRAVDNKRNHVADNAHFGTLDVNHYDEVMIIGGGASVTDHLEAIKEFVGMHPGMAIVFATARHAADFKDVKNDKFYVLVGNEARRMERTVPGQDFSGTCVLSPYPRKMGTEVPAYANKQTFELAKISFTDDYEDSCTTVALQTAIELTPQEIYIVGYDGYRGQVLSDKEMELSSENRTLFRQFEKFTDKQLISLTPSLYRSLHVKSIYQYL